ncbi:MAG: ribosome biogenesis GTPase Der [Bacillaceae bacterium G1]|nr:ribosome biogenesis GTPase Der [Bacillota bacterium]OJF17367.1 MAG: ribosome biogenesis GTPase Der [Bacillaceae bacterium G1]
MAKPTVAIVGRPNVGKSTLFNRLVGERVAIVEDKPGITRDRIYRSAEWQGKEFMLIDTGGIELDARHEMAEQIRQQAELAVDEADVIVFLLDGQTGLTPADTEVAMMLRRSQKPVIVAVNKVDHGKQKNDWYEFYALGLGEPLPISAEHSRGLGDLLDRIVSLLPEHEEDDYPGDTIRIAVIGRPNVGKSSLVNAILGEQRVIVSPIAGTTRDAIDTPFVSDGQSYVLIDTAGMRKRGKIYETTEKYSVLRALRAIERSDVCLLVLDAQDGVVDQDKRIAGYAHEAGRAIIVIVNKWDAIEKDTHTAQRFTEQIRREIPFLDYAPVLFISAKTGQRVHTILKRVNDVAEQHARRIPTALLNDVVADAMMQTPPPSKRGKKLRIHYVTQASVKPPTFVFFVNDPELFHFSYQRYFENRFRAAFQFEGTPLRFMIRERA